MFPKKKYITLGLLFGLLALFLGFQFKTPTSVLWESNPSILGRIPSIIDGWSGENLCEEGMKKAFVVEDFTYFRPLVRTYTNMKGEYIDLIALEDLRGYQTNIHDPRFCYESRGWDILAFEDKLIPLNGRAVVVKKLVYVNDQGMGKRMDLFVYKVGPKIVTSDFALRLAHIANRIRALFAGKTDNVLYLSVSSSLNNQEMKLVEKYETRLMQEILRSLFVQTKKESQYPPIS